ncbi:MAG: hypothetical protein ACOH1V_06655 [Stenotrophomonas sp.]
MTISFPRILPATGPDGSDVNEYQYLFRRDQQRVGAPGFFGTEQVVEQNGDREVRYTLELSPEQVLESILKLQKVLGNNDDKYSFICSVTEGLVNVFSGQASSPESLRYLAMAKIDELLRLGISPPESSMRLPNDWLILAELHVPACDL